ncbi:hypothetical protein GCK72_020171 [Caenorhabditis remanei]|uniref:RRM domain-containing protein n=2 Tax=Caenorhabditis TaxID=6237 RepID=A0A6A5GFS9_CAERE|nr:hypothetical protein GCK72_020171 [Caenorhabditis remanei]KAF1753614.1 hypothetical protein GCK72_020171 [Caenorhabditis remanei]
MTTRNTILSLILCILVCSHLAFAGFPVRITNLSPNSNKDDLGSIFMSAGDINSIMMNRDVAIIDFATEKGAKKAVHDLNRVEFDGRTLTVTKAN